MESTHCMPSAPHPLTSLLWNKSVAQISPLPLDPKSSVTLPGAPPCPPVLGLGWGVQGPSLRAAWDCLLLANPATRAQGTSSEFQSHD